jgi:hypothetical protein
MDKPTDQQQEPHGIAKKHTINKDKQHARTQNNTKTLLVLKAGAGKCAKRCAPAATEVQHSR